MSKKKRRVIKQSKRTGTITRKAALRAVRQVREMRQIPQKASPEKAPQLRRRA